VRFAPSPTGILHIGERALRFSTGCFASSRREIRAASTTTPIKRTPRNRWPPLLGLDCWPELGLGPHVWRRSSEPYCKVTHITLLERYCEKTFGLGHPLRRSWSACCLRVAAGNVIVDDMRVPAELILSQPIPATHHDMTIRRPVVRSWIFHFVKRGRRSRMKISHVIRGEDHLSNNADT